MSVYQKVELQKAKWISTDGKCSTPLLRQVVQLPSVQQAKITIAGLGMYEMYINGKRISDDLFLPLSTDFNKRTGMIYGKHPFEETLSHRLYCPVYDVTDLLQEGKNSICCMMGPGWYEHPQGRYGNIKLCYKIEYTDQDGKEERVYSDETVKWKEGYVTEASLIHGENHDYRAYEDAWMQADFQDNAWNDVCIETAPETNLYIQDCPADKVMRHIVPKLLSDRDGVRIYDVGEIITGYPIFVSHAEAGTSIQVRYGEMLDEHGYLQKEHVYGQHTDFITDGTARKMHSTFTWMCFRYFEVIGDAEVVDCEVIHSDVKVTSDFSCDKEVLNWLKDAYIRTQTDNMHCGIPSDCPHTERRGYTGDGQLTCSAAMLQMDAEKFYRKWIYDIADCQDKETGHVQYTAPFMPSGGGPGGWGCAIVVVPYTYYKYYGDAELFRELYPKMLRWFSYMEAHSEADLVTSDLEGVWCLGDWCAPAMTFNKLNAMTIPEPLVNTYFYIKAMEYVLEMNQILQMHESDALLQTRIQAKKQAIVERYFDVETGDFARNEQGSNAFAVDLGLGDERTFQNIIAHYKAHKQYDTGIFGTDILTRILFERGKQDLAVALLTSEEDVSFYHQMQTGSTTITEYWTVGIRSQCHPMFGAVSRYLYEYILGIRQTKDSVRFEHVVIEPKCRQQIKQAKGHITTFAGKISVEYDEHKIEVSAPKELDVVLRLEEKEYPVLEGHMVVCFDNETHVSRF